MVNDPSAKHMRGRAHPSDSNGLQHQVLQHQLMEGFRVQLMPAPPMRRFLALCTDLGIVTIAVYALGIVLVILAGVLGFGLAKLTSGWMAVGVGMILILILALVAFAGIFHCYFIHFEYKTGATPGKKLFGLRVVSVDGARLSLGQVVIRELLRTYVDIPLIFPVLISIFSTRKKQRIGDLAANTMVVYSRDREDEQKFMYVKQEEYHLLMEYLRPAPVPRDFREAYMKFAYNEFVVRRRPAPVQYLDDWTAKVKKLLPEADVLGLNQQTVLRFFAEYCFQTANKESAGGV